MANKILVIDEFSNEDDEYKHLTLLTGSVKEETIYAEFHSTEQENPDILELAVDLNEMIRMRDFLNNIIEKVEAMEAD